MSAQWFLLAVLMVMAAGCTGDEETSEGACGSATILPHLSPVVFGDLVVLPDGATAEPGTSDNVPFEWVLLLSNNCLDELVISEVCIVGDAHNGDKDLQAFAVEGPVPASISRGEQAAVRLTYNPAAINALDIDGDGVPDPDRIAVVVQSNATDFPTLIVPVCARMVTEDADHPAYECSSPVSLAAGSVDLTLCDRD
ncbi:MAG: hypothetical protein ACI9WU_001038 [Myxococcota bacterium]|jgi:hypothetical protein